MFVFIMIVTNRFFLNRFFDHSHIDMNHTIIARRSGQRRNFQRIQSPAHITFTHGGKMLERIVGSADIHPPQTSLLIVYGPFKQFLYSLFTNGFKLENLRP